MTGDEEHIMVVQVSGGPESFLIGGTIARLIDEGNSVTVVTCVQPINAALREAETSELFRALMELKVTDHRFLGSSRYRRPSRISDRRYYLPEDLGAIGSTGGIPLPTEAEMNPKTGDIPVGVLALGAENIDELDQDFRTIFTEVQPDAVLLALPEKLGVAAEIISQQAIQMGMDYNIPVYQFAWETDPRDRNDHEIDVTSHYEVKREAIAQHHSLGRIVGDSVLLSNAENVLINRYESYHLVYEPFSGWSRLNLAFSSAAAFIAAGFLTLIGTLLHNQTFASGSTTIPSGVILGLIMLACLLMGIRLACPNHRAPLYAASGAIIAAIFIFGLFRIQDTVLIGDTVAGWIWLIGAPMLALLIGLWPRIPLPTQNRRLRPPLRTRFRRKVQ